MEMTGHLKIGAALAALAVSAPVLAQPTPVGIAPVRLTEPAYLFDTAEAHGIKVTVLAKGFPQPFAIEFLPGGDLLVMERGGDLRVIRNATTPEAALDPAPIPGTPKEPGGVFSLGVQDIALHPDFASNGLIYFSYNAAAPVPEDNPPLQRPGFFKILRGKLADGAVSNLETIFSTDIASYAGGSRVALARDGTLYAATPAPFGDGAQDLSSPYGKVLRLNADGSIPADNPVAGSPVYSFGHRDQHGLAIHPETGEVITAEHGPNGGDEANRIVPGGNYGWPIYSYGRNYDGTPVTELPTAPGIEQPIVLWWPSIGPSGMLFYTGDKFPAWKGNLFVGGARWGQINHNGSLQRIVFGANYGELRREALLRELHQRVRDVAQGPDGNIYVLTDGPENAVLRIEPGEL